MVKILRTYKLATREKELENRLNKIESDVGIIKVDAQERFGERREKLSKLEIRINDTSNMARKWPL